MSSVPRGDSDRQPPNEPTCKLGQPNTFDVFTAHIDDALRYLTGLLEVDTEQLAADCVTSAKIADDAVDSEHIVDGAIDPEHLAATVTYKVSLQDFVRGDLEAAPSTRDIGFGIGAGVIVKAGFSLQNTGADGSDPLDLEMDVKVGATSIFTTKPKLEDAAADGSDTFTAGTGITVGVIDTTKDDVAANDRISIEWALTRATPEDEMADLFAEVVVAYKAGV